jgi:hypothetical protein
MQLNNADIAWEAKDLRKMQMKELTNAVFRTKLNKSYCNIFNAFKAIFAAFLTY